MLIDVVLGFIGLISLVYLLFIIKGNWTREKEKVDEFTNAWGTENQPIWVAGNLRQRHTPEFPLPRPFIPSNKIPPLPPEAQSDNTLHSMNQTEIQLPHFRRKSEPNITPFGPYKPNHANVGNFEKIKEPSNLPPVPEYIQEINPPPKHTESNKPTTPVGGIRGTPPIRCIPINVSSLETLYPPPPPLEPVTAPRGSLSPNRKIPKQGSIVENPQISSTTSSTTTATSPIQSRGRSFSDTPFATIDMKDLTLQHVLGGGAFGQVWQAMWKSTPVAVKVLSATCGNNANDEELRAFTDEVQMLAHLRHPNICLFLGASLKPPNRFIVTELISRGSLWDALRKPNIFNVCLDYRKFNIFCR